MSDEGYEQEYIQEAFATNWIAPLGANVDGFEEELARKVGIKSAAALSSGTAAIHLALKCLGVGPDDVVFCQSLTFSARNLFATALILFIDMTMLGISVRGKKKLLKVHSVGEEAEGSDCGAPYVLAADWINLEICRNMMFLIEDAAESLAVYKGNQRVPLESWHLFL